MSASQAVLRVLTSLKEVVDNVQVQFALGNQPKLTSTNSKINFITSMQACHSSIASRHAGITNTCRHHACILAQIYTCMHSAHVVHLQVPCRCKPCCVSIAVLLSHKSVSLTITLQAEPDKNFAKNAVKSIQAACPTSLCLTLHHYAQVHADTQSQGPLSRIDNLMKQEYHGATRMVSRHDFLDGVRAMMVDKDKSPKWDPNDLAAVSDEELNSILEPMPQELELAWKEQVLL